MLAPGRIIRDPFKVNDFLVKLQMIKNFPQLPTLNFYDWKYFLERSLGLGSLFEEKVIVESRSLWYMVGCSGSNVYVQILFQWFASCKT